jgi:hypothetical protein
MDQQHLLAKLGAMFDDIGRNRAWVSVEIEFRNGVANMIRTTKNEKLFQENTRYEPQRETR